MPLKITHPISQEPQEVALHLNDLRDLFVAPEPDPFSEKLTYLSGIDYLVGLFKSRPLSKPTRLTIYLPAESLRPGDEVRVRSALERYCALKMEQNHNGIHQERMKGLKALPYALLLLLGWFSVSAWISSWAFLPSLLVKFLSEGVLVACWVSLWWPVEALIYNWWPYHQENQVYEYLLRTEINLCEEGPENDAHSVSPDF